MALSGFSFRIDEGVSYDVVADADDSTFRHRRATNAKPHRRFTLRWPIISTAEKDALLAEFDAAKGPAGSATLTHPTYGSLTVIMGESLTTARRAAGRWSAELEVEVEP